MERIRSGFIIINIAIISWITGIFIFGPIFGDVDDNFWWHGMILAMPVMAFSRYILMIEITIKIKMIFATIMSAILMSQMAYAIYGIKYNRSIIDGHICEEMEGFVPIFVGVSSIIPFILIMMTLAFKTRKKIIYINGPTSGCTGAAGAAR